MSPAHPPDPVARAGEACIDALYDLLHERAQSIGILDISIELNDGHVDAELLFSSGPDIGFSIDVAEGSVAYCELLDGDRERWLETRRDGLAASDATGPEAAAAVALEALDGLLAARRELVRGVGG